MINPPPPNDESSAQITWNDNGQPICKKFDDVYFSTTSGIDETRYVFLQGNHLAERWTQWLENSEKIETFNQNHNSSFNIFETGFGTGLNFLCTWQAWQSHALHQHATLYFYSVEKYPLNTSELRKALQLWPELAPLSEQLVQQYPPQPCKGMHRLCFSKDNVILTLYFGDAVAGFQQWATIATPGPVVKTLPLSFGGNIPSADAWFLDGFAPAKNPEMWSETIFKSMARLSKANTTFATFTAAGDVRRGLQNAGFHCEKIKGFAHKREMLVGKFTAQTATTTETGSTGEKQQANNEHSWHVRVIAKPQRMKKICVIGGGLAGCHTAFALANKHCDVTLIEKADVLASGASGNPQGAVYAKLSPHNDPLSELNFHAQLFANQFYEQHGFYKECGEQCGVIHLANSQRTLDHYTALAQRYHQQRDFARWINQSETQQLCGLELATGGLFLPQAGWLNPVALCQQLIAHAHIEVKPNSFVAKIQWQDEKWQLSDTQHRIIDHADAVVLANAYDALSLFPSAHLPLKQIRGQVTQLPASELSKRLRTVVCGDGYIAPANADQHTIGATFTLRNFDSAVAVEDQHTNLARLREYVPELREALAHLHPEKLSARVGFRCTTPDYFPVVGPLPNTALFTETFAQLRRNANAVVDSPGDYCPNLYCNLGFGSRGLCYLPLCAELLASIICGEFLPVSRELLRYLHPARFLIRDLTRRKI